MSGSKALVDFPRGRELYQEIKKYFANPLTYKESNSCNPELALAYIFLTEGTDIQHILTLQKIYFGESVIHRRKKSVQDTLLFMRRASAQVLRVSRGYNQSCSPRELVASVHEFFRTISNEHGISQSFAGGNRAMTHTELNKMILSPFINEARVNAERLLRKMDLKFQDKFIAYQQSVGINSGLKLSQVFALAADLPNDGGDALRAHDEHKLIQNFETWFKTSHDKEYQEYIRFSATHARYTFILGTVNNVANNFAEYALEHEEVITLANSIEIQITQGQVIETEALSSYYKNAKRCLWALQAVDKRYRHAHMPHPKLSPTF